jgi:hypothetical protein
VPRKQASHVKDIELIDRLRAGDPTARTAVVRRYHSILVHQASRILRDRGLAEDVVQDAWLAAFACIDGFNPRSSLFPWPGRIVIDRAKALRRREVRSLPFSACATRRPEAGGDDELEFPGPRPPRILRSGFSSSGSDSSPSRGQAGRVRPGQGWRKDARPSSAHDPESPGQESRCLAGIRLCSFDCQVTHKTVTVLHVAEQLLLALPGRVEENNDVLERCRRRARPRRLG